MNRPLNQSNQHLLNYPCEYCNARRGERCHTYSRTPCPPHKSRLVQYLNARKEHERAEAAELVHRPAGGHRF